VKPLNHGPYGMMNARYPPAPGLSVSCDLIGPMPRTSSGYEHALIVTDDFSKNLEIYPIRKATAQVVADKLLDYCCRYGFMEHIRSDNGPQFTSAIWHGLCQRLGIKEHQTCPYRPVGNPTERVNRSVKQAIKMELKRHSQWDKYLPEIAFAIRTAKNESTGVTPALLTFGRDLRCPFALPNGVEGGDYFPTEQDAHSNADKLVSVMTDIVARVKERCEKTHERHASTYNKSRKQAKFEVGDLVLRRTNIISQGDMGVASSLSNCYEGPFILRDKISENVYELVDENGQHAGRRNVDQLRPYVTQPE
jgi:hypothetical protein